MKHHIFSLVSLFVIALLLAACAQQGKAPRTSEIGPGSEADSSSPGESIEDLGSLSQALREAGATIESNETVQQDFFSVEGRILIVNGVDVQVFEYKSAEAMEAEASQVAPDGGSVGTSMVSWMATPHFFKAGRVLVLYVGDDAAMLDLLQSALGEQFAGR